MSEQTYWNGEPCEARRVRVVVGSSDDPLRWHTGLEGTERAAVEVRYQGAVFLLDDEDGSAWGKVTLGRGSWRYGHRSLPADSTVIEKAPCAIRYALGAIVGAAATGELTRQEQGFTPLAEEAMASASCPDCTALLRGEKAAEASGSAVVH